MALRRRSTLSGLFDKLKSKGIIKKSLKKSVSCETLLPPPAPRSPSFSVIAVYTCAMLLDSHNNGTPKDSPVSGRLYLANTLILFQSAEKRVLRARLYLEDIVAVKPILFMQTDNGVSVFGTSGVLKFVLVQHRDELLKNLNQLITKINRQKDEMNERNEKKMILLGQFQCPPRDLVPSLCKLNARFDDQSHPDYYSFKIDNDNGIVEFREGKSLVWMTKAIDTLCLRKESNQSELSLTLVAASPSVMVALRQYAEFLIELFQFILFPYARDLLFDRDYRWKLGLTIIVVVLCTISAIRLDAAVTLDSVYHAQRKAAIEKAKLQGLVHAYKKALVDSIGP